jgi:uncharacterized protein (UPF0264 family)
MVRLRMQTVDGARRTAKTGLLVSVRSAAEARVALAAGADLIDVKEPRNGPLGAASPSVVLDVLQAVDGQVPVSVALGELTDWSSSAWAHRAWHVAASGAAIAGLSFAKLGLAGCAANRDWRDAWRRALAGRPKDVAPVAVVYADWKSAGAPAPKAVFQQGRRLGCRAVLVDTYDKSRGWLLEHWPGDALTDFARKVRNSGLTFVIGGSLSPQSFPDVLTLEPDYVAVRGAACEGGRGGRISGRRVRHLAGCLEPR